MRKFIVSDLYGDREMYQIILSYLEDLKEEVFLVLNGNMIGLELELYDRIRNRRNIIIEYLGGNLELEMYSKLDKGQYREYLGDLNTSYLFREGIYYRRFLVMNGDITRLDKKIKDFDYDSICRRCEVFDKRFATRQFMGVMNRSRYKNPSYYIIKGGIPIHNSDGFYYNEWEHTFMIDGGCRNYLAGDVEYDHVPLLEVGEGFLNIIVFNHEGDIIHTYQFDGKLEEENYKVKRLSKNHY